INGLITEELRILGASWRGIWLAALMQRHKCHAADLLVCGASGWASWLERRDRLPPGRAVFGPNGVDAQPLLTPHRPGARPGLGGGGLAGWVGGELKSLRRLADGDPGCPARPPAPAQGSSLSRGGGRLEEQHAGAGA